MLARQISMPFSLLRIVAALVTLLPGNKTVRTSGMGFYAFVNCKPGKYRIIVKTEFNGRLRSMEMPVILPRGKSVQYDMEINAP